MPSFVALINWTDQGVGNFRDSVERYQLVEAAMAGLGVTLTDIYWTVGPYDMVAIISAPDDETCAAALLGAGAQGNIRTTTMRAFTAAQMRGVIAKAA
jgi:uncharacterized protein with GYD domain